MDTATSLDKGHGRHERRTLRATTALNEYGPYSVPQGQDPDGGGHRCPGLRGQTDEEKSYVLSVLRRWLVVQEAV